MQIPILLETKQYLVLDKPHGLNVERLPQGFPSVEEWVTAYQLQKGIRKPYTGIVHRLDRPVGGLLIVALKKMALKDLNEQFRLQEVQKHYLARVQGRPPATDGELRHWIEKDQLNKKAIAHHKPTKQSVESMLHYKVLAFEGQTSLLEIKPASGKFHQIRVQLASIGCPIVGDIKYGARVGFQAEGIALQAYRFAFTDPVDRHEVVVKLPETSRFHPLNTSSGFGLKE